MIFDTLSLSNVGRTSVDLGGHTESVDFLTAFNLFKQITNTKLDLKRAHSEIDIQEEKIPLRILIILQKKLKEILKVIEKS